MTAQIGTHEAELRLLSIALGLKKLMDATNDFDAEPILDQYQKLREKLIQPDKEASDYLPQARFSRYDHPSKSMMKARSVI